MKTSHNTNILLFYLDFLTLPRHLNRPAKQLVFSLSSPHSHMQNRNQIQYIQ